MKEDILIERTKRGPRLYAEQQPRPIQVNMTQAAEMLCQSPRAVRKMLRNGRIVSASCIHVLFGYASMYEIMDARRLDVNGR